MRARGRCWRGDLAYVLASGGDDPVGAAAVLGFFPAEPPTEPPTEPQAAVMQIAGGAVPGDGPERRAEPPVEHRDLPVPFVRAVSFRAHQTSTAVALPPAVAADARRLQGRRFDNQVPRLMPWPRLWSRARRILDETRVTREIDAARAVDVLARGDTLERLPRRTRRSLAREITFVWEHGAAPQTALAAEVDLLRRALHRRLGARVLDVDLLGGPAGPVASITARGIRRGAGLIAQARGLVLLIGNLDGAPVGDDWITVSRGLLASGRSVACLTTSPSRLSQSVSRVGARVLPLQSDADRKPAAEHAEQVERLLAILYVAVWFDMPLLRKVRLALGRGWSVAEEVALLQHSGVRMPMPGRYRVVDLPGGDVSIRWAGLPAEVAQAVWATIRDHHSAWDPIVLAEAVLRANWVKPSLVDEEMVCAARIRIDTLIEGSKRCEGLAVQRVADLVRKGGTDDPWTRRRLQAAAGQSVVVGPSWLGLDVAQQSLGLVPASPERAVGPPRAAFSPLARMPDVGSEIVLDANGQRRVLGREEIGGVGLRVVGAGTSVHDERGVWTFDSLSKPAWAAAMGRDEFGLYADLEVGNAVQRMRWIPPGGFRMGSPGSEPGRFEDEGPVREVTIEHGFWLADTPCTQQMWGAVMGTSPGPSKKRREPDHPMTEVSWDDVREFVKELVGLAQDDGGDGLVFRMPWEDEWEYSVRAGTTAAVYAGPGKEALDEIAWYDKNSNGSTQPVKRKAPNALGMFDMLGNVWEWCEDLYHPYPGGTVPGFRRGYVGRFRVIRGGSFADPAHYCRSARRDANHPGSRWVARGFRLARGQVRAPGRQEPEQEPGTR